MTCRIYCNRILHMILLNRRKTAYCLSKETRCGLNNAYCRSLELTSIVRIQADRHRGRRSLPAIDTQLRGTVL